MRQLILFFILITIFVSCNNDPSIQLGTAKLKRILFYANSDKKNIRSMATFEYDNSSNLIKQSDFNADTTKAYSYSVFEYENGRKTSESKYDLTDDVYTLSQKDAYQYNWDLLIKNEITKLPDSIVSSYILYFYDENRNLIQTSKFQFEGGYNNLITEYVYDAENLKIKTIRYNGNSGMTDYTKHYYQNKLLTNEKVYTSDDQLISEANYEYDSKMNLIKRTVIVDGKKTEEQSIIYLNNHIIEMISYDFYYSWDSRGYCLSDAVYEYE